MRIRAVLKSLLFAYALTECTSAFAGICAVFL